MEKEGFTQEDPVLNICILARKRLGYNTRVVRQAKVLSEAGHDVTVVSLELPAKELMDMTSNVRYIQINLDIWIDKILRIINQTRNRLHRIVNIIICMPILITSKTSTATSGKNRQYNESGSRLSKFTIFMNY